MKKLKIISLILFGIALITAGVYYYLTVEREIKIYEEYEVYSKRKTGGLGWRIIRTEKIRERYKEKYAVDIPTVDFDKYYLLFSDGRKIKKITYRLISKYKWQFNVPLGIEVFGEKHYPHTAFVYKINRVFLKQDFD